MDQMKMLVVAPAKPSDCLIINRMIMIKGKVFLGLLAGFSVGTLLGALFAGGKKPKEDKKEEEKNREDEEELVVKY